MLGCFEGRVHVEHESGATEFSMIGTKPLFSEFQDILIFIFFLLLVFFCFHLFFICSFVICNL